jgi:hypothetical protein
VRAKPFLVSFLAAIVAVAAISLYVSKTIRKAEKTVTAAVSPDGRYKAVRVSLARGGPMPFCFDTIAVFLAVYPDSFAESDKSYEVYRAPCAPPIQRTDLPKMQWLSNTALQITYAPSLEMHEKGKLRMKAVDASNFVHVTFVAQK